MGSVGVSWEGSYRNPGTISQLVTRLEQVAEISHTHANVQRLSRSLRLLDDLTVQVETGLLEGFGRQNPGAKAKERRVLQEHHPLPVPRHSDGRIIPDQERMEGPADRLPGVLTKWEIPRLCRGGIRSLTVPGDLLGGNVCCVISRVVRG